MRDSMVMALTTKVERQRPLPFFWAGPGVLAGMGATGVDMGKPAQERRHGSEGGGLVKPGEGWRFVTLPSFLLTKLSCAPSFAVRMASMRLDKFIAHATPHSRREVRLLLRAGRIQVDGQTTDDASLALVPEARVTLDGQALSLSGPRYLMLHKPLDVICATTDGLHRTVLDLLRGEAAGLHVAGRLDADSTGLVLLTDDGQWSHRIKAPGRHEKRYRVHTARPIAPDTAARFAAGLLLRGEEDQPTRPARLELLAPCEALVWLQEGRYHQLRRMFAAVGNHVTTLHREAVAGIELDSGLAPGEWRALTPAEVAEGLAN